MRYVTPLLKSFLCLLLLLANTSFAKATRNGFDLSNTVIPIDEILHGGPPRDGIPAINAPQFVTAAKAHYLTPQDRVIGVVINGEARAYPIRILNWHEVVNDVIQQQALSITYCPLCGSGIVYDATINGKAHQFGVSGLLYNSDVLLYDKQTESLWSQILSQAVSGALVKQTLSIVPSAHTSWQAWQEQHPKTTVLSTETGFKRDYSRSPYSGYDQSKATYFPVAFKSKRYHPKERVLGITIKGKQRVYPFAELAKNNSNTISDSFAGETLQIEFDVKNRDGVIKSNTGKVLPSINTFWFAWYGFYPEASVYQF